MKSQNVLAAVRVDSRQISAHFRPSTGRLVISDGASILEAIRAPDSWMALATVNSDSNWGTRPTSADLQVFLERYVAEHPRFDRS
ncbi:conserved hypothetical protein [Paraburkholderia caribensis]|nr:conserved hypothetical protein [Paraburkholderia caribensis]